MVINPSVPRNISAPWIKVISANKPLDSSLVCAWALHTISSTEIPGVSWMLNCPGTIPNVQLAFGHALLVARAAN